MNTTPGVSSSFKNKRLFRSVKEFDDSTFLSGLSDIINNISEQEKR